MFACSQSDIAGPDLGSISVEGYHVHWHGNKNVRLGSLKRWLHRTDLSDLPAVSGYRESVTIP